MFLYGSGIDAGMDESILEFVKHPTARRTEVFFLHPLNPKP